MPEIQIIATIDKSSFSKTAQEIEAKIAKLNQKHISIKATIAGGTGAFGAEIAKGYMTAASAQKQYLSGASQVETALQKQINAMVGINTTTKSAKDSFKVFSDAMKNGASGIKLIADESEAVTRNLLGLDNSFKSAKSSVQAFKFLGKTAFEETLDSAEKQNKEVQKLNDQYKKLGVTIANFAKIKVMQIFTQGIHDAINEMKAMDDELVTIRKVTNATQSEINSLTERAYSVGSAYGVAPSDYLAAVAEFSRAGYGDAAAAMGELAVKTQIVGDVSQDVATQMLLAVDAGYQLGGNVEYLTHVLDAANEIDNNYATSIEKIAEGMGIVAPIAAQAGVSVEELTAALGTITAVTQRSGSETARALRALFLNIMGDTKTEIEDGVTWTVEEVTSVREALAKYAPDAVKAADATKTLINPMQAIGALAQAYEEGILNQQDLMEIVSDMGGKLRSNQLLALIQNWDMFQSMLGNITTSAGSADKEISNALDSWTRKTQILKNTFVELVATGVSSEFVKDILDGATAFLKFEGNLQNILTLAMGLVTIFKGNKIADGIKGIGTALKGAKGGFTALTSWAGVGMVALSTISATISAISDAISQHFENMKQSALDAANNVESIAGEYKNLEALVSEYKELASGDDYAQDTEKQRRVKEIQEEINGLIGEQKNAIDWVNSSLEEQIGLLDTILANYSKQTINDMRAAAISAENDLVGAFSAGLTSIPLDVGFINPSAVQKVSAFVAESLTSIFSARDMGGDIYYKSIASLEDARAVLEDLIKLRDFVFQDEQLKNTNFANYVNNRVKELEELTGAISQGYETLAKTQLTFEAEQMEGGLTPENIQAAADSLRKTDATWKEHASILDGAVQTLAEVASGESDAAEATSDSSDAVVEATGTAKTYAATIKQAKGELDTYKQAQKEVDQQGSISETTMKALLALDADLEDAIRAQTDETGNLTGRYVIQNKVLEENTEAAQENYDAWKDVGNAAEDSADGFDNLSDKVLGVTEEIQSARDAVEDLKDSMEEPDTGDLFDDYAESVERLYELLGQGKIGTNEFSSLFELVFGQGRAAELGYNRGLMAQYAEQHRGVEDFFSSEKAAAEGFLETLLSLADAQGMVLDASGNAVAQVRETDGAIDWNITDAQRLADMLGISVDAVTALTDGMLSMGDGVQYTADQALALAQSVEGAVTALDDGTISVDLGKVAQELLTSGESLESVIKLMQQLKQAEGIEVFNEPTLDTMEQFIALGSSADALVQSISASLASAKEHTLETPIDGMQILQDVAKNAKNEIEAASSALDSVDGQNATATVDVIQNFSVRGSRVVAGSILGKSSAIMLSQSSGSKDYPGGPTVLNEKGPEIIAEGGRAYIVGGGAPAIADLPRGATIFNAEDTRKLLTTGIAARASGTYWKPSPGSNSATSAPSSSSSASGTSSSSSSSSSGKTPDYWETVEDYVDYAMDKLKWLIDEADDRIEGVEKQRDELTDAIDDEIDALEKIEKKIDKQIKEIEKQREEALQPLEEQLEAMRNQKDIQDEIAQLEEKQLAVEEARQALMDAQERTIRVFNDKTGQWEWISDFSAVRDAQKALDDAEKDLASYQEEMKISALEQKIDQIGDLYDKQIEALDDQNEALQEQTEALNEKKEDLVEQYEAMIEPLEAQKQALQEQYDAFEKQWDAIQLTLSEPAEAVSAALQGLRDTSLPAMSGVINDVTSLLSGLGSALGISMSGSGLSTPSYGGGSSSSASSSSSSSSSSKKPSSGSSSSGSSGTATKVPIGAGLGALAGIAAGTGAILAGKFDDGGVASGEGVMQKRIRADELVLGPDITARVLNPKTNGQFLSFAKSLGIMIGASELVDEAPQRAGWPETSRVDSHDTIINGVRIGSDMMQRPLSEVLSALKVYTSG